MFYAIYMATRPRSFALMLVPVYFIKHSVSCYMYCMYIYYVHVHVSHELVFTQLVQIHTHTLQTLTSLMYFHVRYRTTSW